MSSSLKPGAAQWCGFICIANDMFICVGASDVFEVTVVLTGPHLSVLSDKT